MNALLQSFLCVLLLVLVSGCANRSTPIAYHVLHQPTDGSNSSTAPKKTLWLADLSVSDYLLQRGLAVQISDNTLHISNQNIWAEPFESGFKKLLGFALKPHTEFIYHRLPDSHDFALHLELLHLIANQNGEVIINAQYKVTQDDAILASRSFFKRYTLDSDGYESAINVYRQATFDLAQDINTALELL